MLSQDEKQYVENLLQTDLKYSDNDKDKNYIENVIIHLMSEE